jgi:magnesium-transporting ATPase (P-type)
MRYEGIKGLSQKEVENSRRKHGSNELPPPEEETFWDKLKENFEDPIIRILLVALGITLTLAFIGYADWVEGLGIAVAVFLATFVSTYSEYKNESSFRQLQEQASKAENNVFRDGNLVTLFASEIVVGDYVLLQAGDKIPADGLLSAGDLQVNQATLTGEQMSVRKRTSPKNYEYNKNSDPIDEEYACYRGTVVDDGEAILRVESVGLNTHYGQLYQQLSDSEDRETPLQGKNIVLSSIFSPIQLQ